MSEQLNVTLYTAVGDFRRVLTTMAAGFAPITLSSETVEESDESASKKMILTLQDNTQLTFYIIQSGKGNQRLCTVSQYAVV